MSPHLVWEEMPCHPGFDWVGLGVQEASAGPLSAKGSAKGSAWN